MFEEKKNMGTDKKITITKEEILKEAMWVTSNGEFVKKAVEKDFTMAILITTAAIPIIKELIERLFREEERKETGDEEVN
jgi:hypothetical protein